MGCMVGCAPCVETGQGVSGGGKGGAKCPAGNGVGIIFMGCIFHPIIGFMGVMGAIAAPGIGAPGINGTA